jgi:hypothetical protein
MRVECSGEPNRSNRRSLRCAFEMTAVKRVEQQEISSGRQPELLFCQDDLAGVEGEVVGAAEDDGEAIAGGVLGEVFVRDRAVFAEPVLRGEAFEGGGELAVDLGPGAAEIGCGDGISEGAVGIADENLVELGVQAVANEEHGEQAIVNGGEVAEEVEDAILAGSDAILELIVLERGESLIELAEDLLP